MAGARAAHQDFYNYYIADRISGFMGHWMTFSGQELFILLLVAAFLLFDPQVKKWWWLGLPCALAVGIALVLSETRTVWVAALVAGFYLLWEWKRWAAAAMPVVVALGSASPRPPEYRNARCRSSGRTGRPIPTHSAPSSGAPAGR